MTLPQPTVIAYDGSAAGKAAIAAAAELFPDRPAVVLFVWESVREYSVAWGVRHFELGREVVDALDGLAESRSEEIVAEGAELARSLGLDAEEMVVSSHRNPLQRQTGMLASTIVDLADEREAAAIVVASRSGSAVAELSLGSVAYGVLHASRRPVVLVPAPGR